MYQKNIKNNRMTYTKDPQRKITNILRYLKKDWSSKTIEQVAEDIEEKFNVGVFINYGRLIGHTHELEIYRRFKGDWISLLCRVELDFNKFQKPVDF
jgi:hypothetical protein